MLFFLVVLIQAIGIAYAVHAVLYVRTPQGAIAWAVSLVSLPYVAIPLYLIFGRNKFRGYVRIRRSHGAPIGRLVDEVEKAVAPYARGTGNVRKELLAGLQVVADQSVLSGNRVELLIDGDQTFHRMLESIRCAADYILLQFFIVHGDHVGDIFKETLINKARDGVRVFFLYDEFGSRKLPRSYLRDLRAAGVSISAFNSRRGKGNRFQLNFRNHRKLVIVDGAKAFVGGLNLGDEYLGVTQRYGNWRDTHLCVQGPSLLMLQRSFLRDWYWATAQILSLHWEVLSCEENTRVLVVSSGPADYVDTCALMFVSVIHGATRRLWIATPYFVPDEMVVSALQLAAMRGVDVRIMLPERPDHLLVYLSAFSYYSEMHVAGVRIFRYQPGFLHQKVMLVDDDLAVVGTANLDNRSFRLNFETSIIVYDRDFTGKVTDMLVSDFSRSIEVDTKAFDKKPLWFRFVVSVSRLLAPVQ